MSNQKKKAQSAARKTKKEDIFQAPVLQKPEKILSAREVMLHLHKEHKHIAKLLNVLKEQMELIDDGETPDLAIMYDVAQYMTEYSDAFHHPKEDIIYKKLSEHSDNDKAEVVSLLLDHEAASKKTEALLHCLDDARREPSRDHLKILRLRCEDYIANMNRHMDHEESQVFPHLLESLSDDQWLDIINDIQPELDPLFGRVVEQRYENLLRAISSEIERAAEDLAMAELVGLGAAMENIGAIATYGGAIAKTLAYHAKQAYKGNAMAYRRLWHTKTYTFGDYTSVTLDCALNNFDTFTDAMRDISKILRKARTQLAEPYTSRLRIYHAIMRNDESLDTSDKT